MTVFVANAVHISDQKVNGSIPSQLRWFPQLREIDFDGGSLSGPLPEWLGTTFPDLAELDISYNEISGTIPSWLSKMSNLVEFELNYNRCDNVLTFRMNRVFLYCLVLIVQCYINFLQPAALVIFVGICLIYPPQY
jgi:Leucine-rich repeat (LRR) protein